jgi:O-antigen ligase
MMMLIGLMLFLQCFDYKDTNFVPVLELGLTISPDRFVFIIILTMGVLKFMSGELQHHGLGNVGWLLLIFSAVCTVSNFTIGAGSPLLHYLFDFTYNPFIIFLLVKSIPHSSEKLKTVCISFLILGTYLAINGAFEHFGVHRLVWPKYILDPNVGIQFGRTRGSFASSEALGMALIVCFLFFAFYTIGVEGAKRYWGYLMMIMTAGVIYTTNQRAAWVTFGLCIVVLSLARTEMKQGARYVTGVILVAFVLGVGTHFSLWDKTLFSKRQNTVDYRKVNNETTLKMAMANPIFGVGYGKFKTEWPKYFQETSGSGIRDLTDGNHNTFLGIASDLGLVGFTPYLAMIGCMFLLGIRVYTDRKGFDKCFSLVAILVLVTYVFGANFSDYRSGPFFNAALFLLFGCVAAMDPHTKRSINPAALFLLFWWVPAMERKRWRSMAVGRPARVWK